MSDDGFSGTCWCYWAGGEPPGNGKHTELCDAVLAAVQRAVKPEVGANATLRTFLTTALSLLRRWESYLETVVEDESDDGMLAEDTRALLAKHPEKP